MLNTLINRAAVATARATRAARPSATTPRTTPTAATSNNRNNNNRRFQQYAQQNELEKSRVGGLEVVVAGNPMHAYRELNENVYQAGLRQLERRYFWHIKPKIKRKLEADKRRKEGKCHEFNRRLSIAIEMMERENEQ